MSKYLIVSATRGSNVSNTQLGKSVSILKAYCDQQIDAIDLQMPVNNADGLSVVYNKSLTKSNLEKYTGILFVHDDVFIDDVRVFDKLETAFNAGNSVVGLAGGAKVKIKTPALWHIMSEKASQSGSVTHPYTEDTVYTSSYGPVPSRCLIMDGLFLAINSSKFINSQVKFDEQFDFHHYDLDFCLQCNSFNHKMTTWNINVTHSSPGLLDFKSERFNISQQKFLSKYVKN